MKKSLLVLLAVAIGFGIVSWWPGNRPSNTPVAFPRPVAVNEPAPRRIIPSSQDSEPSLQPLETAATNSAHAAAPITNEVVKVAASPQSAAPPSSPPVSGKDPIQDPVARVALSLVGADRGAEMYWMWAINDPNLPPEERKDLIEDLNEDGLSDPKHPGPEDLPLIANRIQLIENLAPFAMDVVNAEAFAEAYKDLVNLLNGEAPK